MKTHFLTRILIVPFYGQKILTSGKIVLHATIPAAVRVERFEPVVKTLDVSLTELGDAVDVVRGECLRTLLAPHYIILIVYIIYDVRTIYLC